MIYLVTLLVVSLSTSRFKAQERCFAVYTLITNFNLPKKKTQVVTKIFAITIKSFYNLFTLVLCALIGFFYLIFYKWL